MSNHLKSETSPYLLQHANNPVEWYPWGQEAIDRARREKKAILLSIGYASCHWCHVMAHESFEDEETARLMNNLFVNIKVDREERPDLDKVYQTAHYFLTQQPGGWPLTIFLSSDDLTPFFSGTYFPKTPRYQLPAFKDLLQKISGIYNYNFADVQQQNVQLQNVLHSQVTQIDHKIQIDKKPLELVEVTLSHMYDAEFGGFGHAPKFPRPTILEFLLHQKSAMAFDTLRHMAYGGINDQLEGGFFRYSVDEKWQIPHFEKMLYDNAQLLYLYALAAKQTKENIFIETTRQTAQWAIAKMQSPEGGFFSSLDADSEGHEGKFYVWNKFEIEELLDENEAKFADVYFGLHDSPNFENQWHLHAAVPLEVAAKKFDILPETAHRLLERIRQKLFSAREKRIHPVTDTKVLISWNALMIKGLLVAGYVLNEPTFIDSAETALNFIHEKMWVNGRLLAAYKDGKAHLQAYLDDYAFLLDALVTSLKIKTNFKHLVFAKQLAEILLADFYDSNSGGFYFTAKDHEKLLYRPKVFNDEALPSGNAIAIRALIALEQLGYESKYDNCIENSLRAAWSLMTEFPMEHCSMLLALMDFIEPPKCSYAGCGI